MAIYAGSDASGSGNNWQVNSINTSTNGITYDLMVDVPGIASTIANDVGGVVRGNYCTLNPLQRGSNPYVTLYDGNLKVYGNTATNSGLCSGTFSVTSGKWYYEFTQGTTGSETSGIFYVDPATLADSRFINAEAIGTYDFGFGVRAAGTVFGGTGLNPSLSNGGVGAPSYTTGDVISIAIDADNGAVYWAKNGTWAFSGNPLSGGARTGALGTWSPGKMITPLAGAYNTGFTNHNFGQRPFSFTPPAGYKTLCTTNLPNPVIKKPSDHFDVKTYTGNGSSLTVGNTAKQTSTIQIKNSLRFNPIKRSYLTRVYPGSPTSRTTMTFSAWVKPGQWQGSQGQSFIYGTYNNYENTGLINPSNTNGWPAKAIRVTGPYSSSQQGILITNPVLTDDNKWYHIVTVYDTTNASPTERIRLYVNGVKITSFYSVTLSNQNNTTTEWLNQSKWSNIGITGGANDQVWDGELTEVNIIDGQALDATYFGQFDANNNWVPKAYTGTYGNNGCYLPMKPVETFGTTNYVTTLTGTNYLSVADNAAFNFGTGSYTIEGWFNTGYLPRLGQGTADGWVSVIGSYNSGTAQGWYLHIDNAGSLLYGTNGATELYSTHKITDGLWHHIAIVRNGSSTTTLYVDGKAVTSAASTNSGYSSTAVRIGSLATGYERYYAGTMSNIRITKGVAVYTGEFTVPTLPLAATQSSGTNISAITAGQCSLLTCQSSTHVDNSGNNFTITNNNSVASPSLDYITAKGTFSDYSGNNNHWSDNGRQVGLAPTVLTYGTPGTYTWTAPAGVTSVDVLVVAGGGGSRTGGGGAGGVIYNKSYTVTPSTGYTVTVGAGGTYNGGNGSNSVFATLTAIGGGAGANDTTVGNGGSGGGGYIAKRSDGLTWGPTAAGTGTSGQGFKGGEPINPGNPPSSSYGVGGGGGGAGGPGQSNYGWQGGNGGPGLCVPITGFPTYYGGGGAGQGGYASTGGIPGIGGGGWAYGEAGGQQGTQRPAIHGTGGGGGGYSGSLGYGGNGIVIISYTNANSYVGTGANAFDHSATTYDSPTDYDDGSGNIRGSYATWSTTNSTPAYYTTATLNDNDTLATGGAINTSWNAVGGLTIPTTGKWYWEAELSATVYGNGYVGISAKNQNKNTGWRVGSGILLNDGSTAYSYTSYNTGSTNKVGIAYDADAGKMWYTDINGAWLNSKTPGIDTTGLVSGIIKDEYLPFWSYNSGAETNLWIRINFGQTPFRYTQPTGFKTLNTKNLKDAGSYNLPDNYGNFVNTPDLVWLKSRSGAYDHQLADTVRGPRRGLKSDTTAVESAEANGVQTFLPNGFQVAAAQDFNNSGSTYVSWNWNRGQIPGFDIVTYAGTGAVQSINHSLGQVPKFIIVKKLSSATNSNWMVQHASLGPTNALNLNNTSAAGTTYWNSVSPTSTTFTVDSNANYNASGDSFVAYLWAEVPGFSKFGSYVGNSSTDGPFIYTGFKPRWVMVKAAGTANGTTNNTAWTIWDTQRDLFNPTVKELYPYSAVAEGTDSNGIDILSNGFKPRRNSEYHNWSGTTYIYAAFAEAPFKYANAR